MWRLGRKAGDRAIAIDHGFRVGTPAQARSRHVFDPGNQLRQKLRLCANASAVIGAVLESRLRDERRKYCTDRRFGFAPRAGARVARVKTEAGARA